MDWSPESLRADTAWLRRLARRLVTDGATADDLVQEAWVLALDREERPSRAWLGAVVRKLSFTRERSKARRVDREARAARQEGGPDAAEALACVEAQRLLADAILGLDEPYRTALVLRYTQDLTTGDIAARMGAPLGTVHSWLKRGLERLRAELERRRGRGREGWLSALAPLAGLRRVAPQAAAVGAGWGTKVAVTAGIAALRVGLGLRGDDAEGPPPCDLRVVVTGPDGVPVNDFEVSLLSHPGRQYLDGLEELEPEPGGWLRGVPSGRYVASAWIGYREANARGLYLPERRREVDLVPGVENRIVFAARARVSVHLDVDRRPDDAGAQPSKPDPRYLDFLAEFGVVVQLGSVKPSEASASPTTVVRRLVRDLGTPGPRRLMDGWMPGETATHWTVEPPGRYPLRVEGQRWRTVEDEVVLRGGETTSVRVVLSPR